MSGRRSVVFVVDGGGAVGWGHLVRSTALAGELDRRGCRVSVHLNGEAPPFALDPRPVETGEPLGSVPSEAAEADVVVLDLYSYAAATPEGVGEGALLVAVIDSAELPFEADLVIDPNVSGLSGTRRAAGPGAAMLRPEFDPVPNAERRPGSLVVSFGGAPPENLVRISVEAAERQAAFDDVTFVLPARHVPARDIPGMTFATAVSDMAALLRSASAGLLAAGTLMHEACACGLPAAIVSFTDDQRREAEAIAREGAVVHLGDATELDAERLVAALTALGAIELRARLSERALGLGLGEGRARVADLVLARAAGEVAPW